MKTVLTAIFAFFTSLNPLFSTVALIGVSIVVALNWIAAEWAVFLGKLDAMAQSNFGSTLNVSPLGLVDTFVPLHETLALFTVWVALLVAASGIRIVKSFIPTVAT